MAAVAAAESQLASEGLLGVGAEMEADDADGPAEEYGDGGVPSAAAAAEADSMLVDGDDMGIGSDETSRKRKAAGL